MIHNNVSIVFQLDFFNNIINLLTFLMSDVNNRETTHNIWEHMQSIC